MRWLWRLGGRTARVAGVGDRLITSNPRQLRIQPVKPTSLGGVSDRRPRHEVVLTKMLLQPAAAAARTGPQDLVAWERAQREELGGPVRKLSDKHSRCRQC